ncbi:unnamed protein product [Bemisia tabaci]|uniref:Uncharacterized protein n=1 Tax=Bemisia tabaci TaxID=7038 RepID=A0A9P0F1R9_BEMTA|nr:unnamed protein product [Bemisia tabaci]
MTATMAIRLLLGVLCLNELLRPHAQADQVLCKSAQFAEGTVITATSNSVFHKKRYCASTIGYFIAVRDDKLFHLECSTEHHPTQATAKITELKNTNARNQFFGKKEMCEVKSRDIPTMNNMKVLAEKLAGNMVPYDPQSCNAAHYTEYLTKGAVQNYNVINDKCPVFNRFNGQSSINMTVFKLAGRNDIVYEWPARNTKGLLVPSTMKKQSANVPPRSNSRSRQYSGFTGNGSTSNSNTSLRGYRSGGWGGAGGRPSAGNIPGVIPGEIPRTAGGVFGGSGGGGRRGHHDSSVASGGPKPFWRIFTRSRSGSKKPSNV